MPKLHDLIGRDQNKDLLSRNCMLEMRPCSTTDSKIGSDWGWKSNKTTEVFCKRKVVFHTNFERMFKRTATDLDAHSRQRRSTDWRIRSKMPGCCCLSNTCNKILLRISISQPLTTIAGFDGADQRLGLPGHRTSHQWTFSYGATLKPWFKRRQLIVSNYSNN
jgi:hypothetical protein